MISGAASSPEALKQAKAALRQEILARRDAADIASRSRASQFITQRLRALPEYREATSVAAYASFGSELDTWEFLTGILADRKQLLLPRINAVRRMLELRHVVDLDADLVPGVWGIREPAERCPLLSDAAVGFMLVPGVAFTVEGARLGYGGGFYDRLIASLGQAMARVAAAFNLQLVDQLPEGPLDQRVHRVITEKN
jgi:5-formyltetrahydrofolate cyclo-ligase